jgi:hypothetical protein
MRRTALASILLALSLGTGAEPAAARAITTKGNSLGIAFHELTYTVTICTHTSQTTRSVFGLRATFTPVGGAHGAKPITTTATVYQTGGCWPAFIGVPLARAEPAACGAGCPAVVGQRYRAQVVIRATGARTRRTPALEAVA